MGEAKAFTETLEEYRVCCRCSLNFHLIVLQAPVASYSVASVTYSGIVHVQRLMKQLWNNLKYITSTSLVQFVF